jgi:hypothetical protein
MLPPTLPIRTIRVGADLGGAGYGPVQRGVGLLVLGRVVRLGCPGVVDEDDDCLGLVGELAAEPLVGVLIAEDPAAAAGVEHHRQHSGGVGRADDPDADFAGRAARDRAVVDLGGRQLDGDACLDLAQYFAGVRG